MRIISQDGMIDFSYEQTVINIDYRDGKIIKAEGCHCDGENSMFTIARYSTEAKARKAMEMLRDAYCGIFRTKKEMTDSEIRQKIIEEIRSDFLRPISRQEPKAECKYFQFPADDEVEI